MPPRWRRAWFKVSEVVDFLVWGKTRKAAVLALSKRMKSTLT